MLQHTRPSVSFSALSDSASSEVEIGTCRVFLPHLREVSSVGGFASALDLFRPIMAQLLLRYVRFTCSIILTCSGPDGYRSGTASFAAASASIDTLPPPA